MSLLKDIPPGHASKVFSERKKQQCKNSKIIVIFAEEREKHDTINKIWNINPGSHQAIQDEESFISKSQRQKFQGDNLVRHACIDQECRPKNCDDQCLSKFP